MIPKVNTMYMEMLTERNTRLEQIASGLNRAGIWSDSIQLAVDDNNDADDEYRFIGGEI